MRPKARKPDYRVGAMHKRTNLKTNVGGAWRNEDGSITVILDPFVTLTQDGDLLITLFDAATWTEAPLPQPAP